MVILDDFKTALDRMRAYWLRRMDSLQGDSQMQALEIKYGFRTSNPGQFKTFATGHGVALPDSLSNVIDPPTYEVLEYMISVIEKKIGGQ